MAQLRKIYLTGLAGLTLALTGCATASRPAMEMSDMQSRESGPAGRLVIKTASSSVVVDKIAKAILSVEAILQKENGYMVKSSLSGDNEAALEFRVPEKQLGGILDQIAALGREEYRQVVSCDVTDQVRDQEAVLKNKQALRERLRDLLAKAKSVQDVIAVEEQLARLQSEIESIEGYLKKSKNDVEYSAVQLKLVRTTVYGPLGYIGYGLCWVIGKLFIIQ